jgi:hypothetical protein
MVYNVRGGGVQIGLWVFAAWGKGNTEAARVGSNTFMAFVSVVAALGFLIYGGRLFNMLRRFPIESRGRRKKLREVGLVTAICATCFTLRAVLVAWSAFDAVSLSSRTRLPPAPRPSPCGYWQAAGHEAEHRFAFPCSYTRGPQW